MHGEAQASEADHYNSDRESRNEVRNERIKNDEPDIKGGWVRRVAGTACELRPYIVKRIQRTGPCALFPLHRIVECRNFI